MKLGTSKLLLMLSRLELGRASCVIVWTKDLMKFGLIHLLRDRVFSKLQIIISGINDNFIVKETKKSIRKREKQKIFGR